MSFDQLKRDMALALAVCLFSAAAASCDNGAEAADVNAVDNSPGEKQQGLPYSSLDGNSRMEDRITLNVALSPNLADTGKVQSVIEAKWKENHSGIRLNFKTWNCYEEEEVPDSLDVFVFDALYLNEYVKNGELLALDGVNINEPDDILEFVREDLTVDGTAYGIPQMIDARLLFYRKGDEEIESADNVAELYDVMGDYVGTEVRPAHNEGLLVDMSSSAENIFLYLDAFIDANAVYNDDTVTPELDHINEQAAGALDKLILMAGCTQAYTYMDDGAIRAAWFSQGAGRAYIGYSESIALMGGYMSDVQIKTMSLADQADIPLFYADVVGVNSALCSDQERRELAVELMNLMTDSEVMTAIAGGNGEAGHPSFILPVRTSVYENLETEYPIYTRLKEITAQSGNHVFCMGEGAHGYIARARELLPDY